MSKFFRSYWLYIFVGVFLGLALSWINNNSSNLKLGLNTEPISVNHRSLNLSFSEAVKKASPSVVNLFSSTYSYPTENKISSLFSSNPDSLEKSTEAGSGVIVSKNGYIVTNHHVVKKADEIIITLTDGKTYPAIIVGSDPETDLSIIKIDANNLIPIVFGESKRVQVGDVALAIGNPFGQGQSVSMGIISATGKDKIGLNTYENFIQTDAAINPGNSGGALVDPSGEMIGINSAIFSRSGGSQGIGFAIPVSTVKNVLFQIVDKGYVTRGWLGVEGRDLTPFGRDKFGLDGIGIYITGVYEGGPAQDAGIQAGDILIAANDIEIEDIHTILKATEKFMPGKIIELVIQRDGKLIKTKLKVQQRPLSTN